MRVGAEEELEQCARDKKRIIDDTLTLIDLLHSKASVPIVWLLAVVELELGISLALVIVCARHAPPCFSGSLLPVVSFSPNKSETEAHL